MTTPVLGRPPAPQTALHVASNGSIALAVWNDPRNGRSDVTACRIAADETPLDATGIVVQTGANAVDVFWSGTSFAVITQMPEIVDPRRATAPGSGAVECIPDCVPVPTRVVAMRLRPDGSHIDAAPPAVSAASSSMPACFRPENGPFGSSARREAGSAPPTLTGC